MPTIRTHLEKLSRRIDRLSDSDTELKNYLNNQYEELKRKFKEQDERWEMLKNYLGVEEKEYAELKNIYDDGSFDVIFKNLDKDGDILIDDVKSEIEPVKKRKLVKKKKSNNKNNK